MKTNERVSGIIRQLEKTQDELCVSVLVPTQRLSKVRVQNPKRIEQAIEKANAIVAEVTKSRDVAIEISNKLAVLSSGFDNLHSLEGVGLFVSPSISITTHFPFPINQKISVGESFVMRDLYYFNQVAINYNVLLLNKNNARLFHADLDQLEEVEDTTFPSVHDEEYEYATPAPARSVGNALQSFERDKNQLREIRMESFYKKVDKQLADYHGIATPLIVAGVGEQIAQFKKATRHLWSGEVIGNFDNDIATLGKHAWQELNSSRLIREQSFHLEQLVDGIGRKKAVTGLRAVWDAVGEGRGLRLLVEKDFIKSGYLSKSSEQLFLKPPKMKYDRYDDIVDRVLQIAKSKGTEIFFFENDTLEDWGRIALILRY